MREREREERERETEREGRVVDRERVGERASALLFCSSTLCDLFLCSAKRNYYINYNKTLATCNHSAITLN